MKEANVKTSRTEKFSVRYIDSLPAHDQKSRSAEQEYSDSECRGLKLSVSKNGRKHFNHRFLVKHGNKTKRRSIRIGEYPFVTLKEARQIVAEQKVLLNKGIDPLDERQKAKKNMSFNEFFETIYMPKHAQLKKKSWQDDQRMYNLDLKSHFKGYLLSEIEDNDINTLLDQIAKRASGPRANRYRSLISKVFSLAIKMKNLEGVNPCKSVDKFSENSHSERFLSGNEILNLKKALDTVKNKISAKAVWFLLSTGCRVGEAMKMTWEMVDFENNVVNLPHNITKSGKSRKVLLNDQAFKTLIELEKLKKPDNPYVFPGRVKGSHLTTPRKTFDTAKQKAGIENFRLHDLRHTFASIAIQSGEVSIYDLKELLGHSCIKMTMRYSHLDPKTLTKATGTVASKLSSFIN